MNNQTKNRGSRLRVLIRVALMCGAIVGLGAAVHAATVGPTFRAEQNNEGGTDFTVMVPTAGRACYLTGVNLEDTDSVAETAGCHVTRQGGSFVLEARLGQDDDADARCEAMCITF